MHFPRHKTRKLCLYTLVAKNDCTAISWANRRKSSFAITKRVYSILCLLSFVILTEYCWKVNLINSWVIVQVWMALAIACSFMTLKKVWAGDFWLIREKKAPDNYWVTHGIPSIANICFLAAKGCPRLFERSSVRFRWDSQWSHTGTKLSTVKNIPKASLACQVPLRQNETQTWES